MSLKYRSLLFALLTLTALAFGMVPQSTDAAGVVTHCTDDSDFTNKLQGGGLVTFNCGNQTIVLSSTKTIALDTTIDGGGKIKLSGDNARRLFQVDPGKTLSLKNLVIENGFSNTYNGGAISSAGALEISNTKFLNNQVSSALVGGAIYTSGKLEMASSVFRQNQGGSGGAIFVDTATGDLFIEHSRFQQNETTASNGVGGALVLGTGASGTIAAGSSFSKNQAVDGGAIYAQPGSTLEIAINDVIKNNTASNRGGGIFAESSTIQLSDLTVSGNHAVYGGGIYNLASIATLSAVTLSGNHAFQGGGIYDNTTTATLTNITLSGNQADSAYGAGLDNYQSTVTLTNVTFAGNHGDGIYSTNYPTTHLNLKNVLLAAGASGKNCDFDKAPDSSDSNFSDDTTCNFGSGRDGLNPGLGPLETNGGFTLTHRLLPGSAAIDKGTIFGCAPHDQRGVARYYGHSCEVGAFEFVPCVNAPTKPQQLAPAQGAKVKKTSVLLDWAGPDCAISWRIIVRRDSQTGHKVFKQKNIMLSQVTTSTLTRNHPYFWQVTACLGTICTKGDWWTFTVK